MGFVLLFSVFAFLAYANNSWGSYHWGRTSNPFILKLADNLSSSWDPYLATTSADWSLSTVLDTTVVPSETRGCKASNGSVEVCNGKYGFNGWLGIAQIWINTDGHIVKGMTKVNDTYFNTSTYNTPAWRNLVMCQEVGHTLGLAHQDEVFDNPNLGTCMDYTNNPLTNQHPNDHDYAQLELIYEHLDDTDTTTGSLVSHRGNGSGAEGNLDDPSAWGKAVKQDEYGKNSPYERNLGNGEKLFTFIIWAE